MTKIIATIGPSSEKEDTLSFFAHHSVKIARLNCSHRNPDWHRDTAKIVRKAGLEVLFDLAGPKIRLGEISETTNLYEGQVIRLEVQETDTIYPNFKNGDICFPYQFPIHKYISVGEGILIDDGKIELQALEVGDGYVQATVVNSAPIKSRKGINLPDSNIEVNYLGERDKLFVDELLVEIRPEYIAASFVKTKNDILDLKNYIQSVLDKSSITDYYPKICAKLEMRDAVNETNLEEIVNEVDLIMIARGDLALETRPLHLAVPFLQDKIKQMCISKNKPFVVATQILESMITSPVPTRAEVSDLYRAVITDQADFIMCSGETAAGMYPKNCILLMDNMIKKQ